MPRNARLALLLFGLAALAHALFSPLGFSPTDEGFVLALGRRLLEGQVPHRDFIAIRPVGSSILHLLEVAWGGDYAFWFSRLVVWLQYATIAFAWTVFLRRRLGGLGWLGESACAAVVFVFTSHTFPVMAWHATDGLFLFSIGLLLVTLDRPAWRLGGFALIGATALCKQSFVPLALGAPLLLGARRSIPAWLAVASPAIAYFAYLAAQHAVADAALQLATRGDVLRAGVAPYLGSPSLWIGIVLGLAAAHLELRARDAEASGQGAAAARWAAVLQWAMVLVAALALTGSVFESAASFLLFGAVLGATLRRAIPAFRGERSGSFEAAIAGGLALLATWSASLSIGYATPALGSGMLAALLLHSALRLERPEPARLAVGFRVATAVVVLIAFAAFGYARREHIYRERPARQLFAALNETVYPGTRMIRTNPVTYQCLQQLTQGIGLAPHREIVILPDFPSYWVGAAATNPISIDWAQDWEMPRPELVARVVADLEERRGRVSVFVQKVELRSLPGTLTRLHQSDYAVVRHVREHWTRVGESEFFELYQ